MLGAHSPVENGGLAANSSVGSLLVFLSNRYAPIASCEGAKTVTFQRFEDILAWQAARRLASQVYAVSARGKFARDFALRDQIRRATISMMANVAEGFARKSDREFAHFLFTGKGSAAEAQSHLYVALDLGYIDDSSFRQLFSQIEIYAREVSGLISYLTGQRNSQGNRPVVVRL